MAIWRLVYFQEFDYFTDNPTAKIQNMESLEKLVEALAIDE